jgi:AcrR family transcriptional regulator
MPTEGTAGFRESYRAYVRERTLAVAYAAAVEKGWDKVRVGQVAAEVGVSRALLYKEFGDKQGLGEALVLRESERFLVGIQRVLAEHGGGADAKEAVADAVRASVAFTLAHAAESPLLRAMLVPAHHPSPVAETATALPLLTSAARLVELAGDTLVAMFQARLTDLSDEELRDATDAVVRLTVSHVALPGAEPQDAGRRIGEVALRYLRLT